VLCRRGLCVSASSSPVRIVPCAVHAWSWVPSDAGQRRSSRGDSGAAGACCSSWGSRRLGRPSTVMPPAPGKRTSHLIVGMLWHSRSCVCCRCPASPSCTRTGWRGCEVCGLAADPWGTALAVCDYASQSTHVLAWPLPGHAAVGVSTASATHPFASATHARNSHARLPQPSRSSGAASAGGG